MPKKKSPFATMIRSRLRLLCPVLRQFQVMGASCVNELAILVELELGSLDAVDRWVKYGRHLSRAIPPEGIYLICPHNLPISAWQGITRALILGSPIHLKLSSTQIDPIKRFIGALPPALRRLVSYSTQPSLSKLSSANVVMVFGNDETLRSVRQNLRPSQKFLGYGHRVSLIWMGKNPSPSPDLWKALVTDLCQYEQLGCLSPQAIYLEKGANLHSFCQGLAEALAKLPLIPQTPTKRLQIAMLIRDFRSRMTQASCWTPVGGGTEWTIIQHHAPGFQPSCGYRTIHVYEVPTSGLARALSPIKGQLSTVATTGHLTPAVEQIFMDLGATRFCAIGNSQFPLPTWHHDGRPQLGDMVTWIDKEIDEY